MSADSWGICPGCLGKAQAAQQAAARAAAESYGNIPPEEYNALVKIAGQQVYPEDYCTFREEYEFCGTGTGTVHVSYSGHCTSCDVGVDFSHEHRFYPGGEENQSE